MRRKEIRSFSSSSAMPSSQSTRASLSSARMLSRPVSRVLPALFSCRLANTANTLRSSQGWTREALSRSLQQCTEDPSQHVRDGARSASRKGGSCWQECVRPPASSCWFSPPFRQPQHDFLPGSARPRSPRSPADALSCRADPPKSYVLRTTLPAALLTSLATCSIPELVIAALHEDDKSPIALVKEMREFDIDAGMPREWNREEGAAYGVLALVLALILVNGKVLGEGESSCILPSALPHPVTLRIMQANLSHPSQTSLSRTSSAPLLRQAPSSPPPSPRLTLPPSPPTSPSSLARTISSAPSLPLPSLARHSKRSRARMRETRPSSGGGGRAPRSRLGRRELPSSLRR